MTSYTIDSLVLSAAFLLDAVVVIELVINRQARGKGLSVREIGFALGLLCVVLGLLWKQAYSIHAAYTLAIIIYVFPALSIVLVRRIFPRHVFSLLLAASIVFLFCAFSLAQGLVRGDL